MVDTGLAYVLHTRYSNYDYVIIENKYGENMCSGSVDFLCRILSTFVLCCDVITHSKEVIRINYI